MSTSPSERPRELKMWLAVRTDLDMSLGKACAQAGHAFGHLHLLAQQQKPVVFKNYLENATPKITVRVDGESALLRVHNEAQAAGITSYIVHDAGRSELEPNTATVCAFGPAYHDELPSFLKRLRLL
jgi:PTH2 family peptidyl-tRNA hydrolase